MSTKGSQESEGMRDELYRKLPSVNELILAPALEPLIARFGRERVVHGIRQALRHLRDEIAAGGCSGESLDEKLDSLVDQVNGQLQSGPRYSLRRVINASGVLLHTNLGRAPLGDTALAHLVEVASDYSNLELELKSGERSRRDVHVEDLVLRVVGVPEEDFERRGVVVVNNCAAATFLALNTLAEKREVVVSRGELVEIGGGFRIPEILEKSGAVLREVGTTNRTRISDYEHAISEQASLLLRVHQSNFSIEGFTERPSLDELVSLSQTAGVPLFEDQGTGLVWGLERFGIHGQPTLRNSIEKGVDLVAASGDKLLGGPQCGLLIGRSDLIGRIRKNPLLRAFRVDKLTYAALEATLFEYLTGSVETIPLMQMLSTPAGEIEQRCRAIVGILQSGRIHAEVMSVDSVVGGGTAPDAKLPSYAVVVVHAELSAGELLKALRQAEPPIIGRINDEKVILDLRTVSPRFDEAITRVLERL
ncbi:MAG TPA: L-seryl-tRNA(Sec) selenium transferase [Terracidiphilus sp.]|jgi:L-seryl-tRNA(Ser) seleniumtransferase